MIKEIKTTSPGLYLEIDLGCVCNYKCSFCPPYLNSGKEWLSYEHLLKFIKKVKPKTVLLVGGEPTLYPKIEPLLLALKTRNIYVHITSNGSKPLSWWKENSSWIDVLTLSYHIEHANLNQFIEKLKYISNKKVVTVNVSMIVEKFDECLKAALEISKVKNVYTSLKALNNIQTGLLYEYNNDQLEIMSKMIKPKIVTKENSFNIHFYGVDEYGVKNKLRAQSVISNKENSYKGWLCWKGIDTMKIDSHGNVFKAICDLGKTPFANIYEDEISLPKNPEVCTKEYCFCLTDLKSITKRLK